jgi:hypothetical protein
MELRLHAIWLAIALHAGAIWAVIGPFLGVLVGAWLTARWQRKQWILDNKKAEYRQLLDAVQAYRWHLLNRLAAIRGPLVAIDARTYNEEAAAREHSRATLNNCLADRLFIRERIARNKVKEELGNFLRTMHQVSEGTIHDLEKFHDRIVHVAEADLRLN